MMVIMRTANEIWSVARFLQYFIFPPVFCADSVTIFDQVSPSTRCKNKNNLTSDSVLFEGGGEKNKKKVSRVAALPCLHWRKANQALHAEPVRLHVGDQVWLTLNRKHFSKQVIKHGLTGVQTLDDNPVKTFTAIYLKNKKTRRFILPAAIF